LSEVGFVVGMLIGLGGGISIGIAIGKKQKPWSELNEKEKRARIWLIAVGVVLVVAGAVAFWLVAV